MLRVGAMLCVRERGAAFTAVRDSGRDCVNCRSLSRCVLAFVRQPRLPAVCVCAAEHTSEMDVVTAVS